MSAREAPAPALPNSYWVIPGQLLAGEHPGGADSVATRERLERLFAAGVDCIVDLTQRGELPPYDALLPAEVQYHPRPIRDHALPAQAAHMLDILELIQGALAAGRCVYVHCRAGIGRTGTVIGCLLVERGLPGETALERLNELWQGSARARDWPSVPETEAQIGYVRHWRPALSLGPAALAPAPQAAGARESKGGSAAAAAVPPASALAPGLLRPRFAGALVGLATVDALAAPAQQLGLPTGAWTDDTAMALCVADSLLAINGFDPRDQLERYARWQQEGYLSATGRCVGITAATQRALASATWRRQVFPGSHDPRQADAEPLSRVAPAVMFGFASADQAVTLAGDAARTTVQAPQVLEACRVFAAMLHAALRGAPKDEVLCPVRGLEALEETGYRARVRSLLRGRYRGKQPHQLRRGGSILDVLEAALWAFARTEDFRSGALLAITPGAGFDVIGAAYGQIAGAYYAVEGIPLEWRTGLARLGLIEDTAARLLRAAFA